LERVPRMALGSAQASACLLTPMCWPRRCASSRPARRSWASRPCSRSSSSAPPHGQALHRPDVLANQFGCGWSGTTSCAFPCTPRPSPAGRIQYTGARPRTPPAAYTRAKDS
jgi:hypothetical protein